VSSAPYSIGYCTNVHAGATLDQTRANLERHALAVKQRYSPDRPMGVGLWLSAKAAEELLLNHGEREFAEWLATRGLVPYTLNGFPFGDFHERVVKHRVYEPTWWQPERLLYTMQLVQIHDAILPPGMEGSISTLPIAWGAPCPDRGELEQAANQLRQAAQWMHQLEAESGRLIYLCLEPEPGCVLSFADDAIHFFQWQLFGHEDEEVVRRHIRICHDICHAAVMFEPQEEVLAKYAAAGIQVGKFQVSAALRMDLDLFEPPAAEARKAAIKQLSQFAEDRYLHQTVVRRGGEDLFYEDLRPALEAEALDPRGEWRVHFHVPIYLKEFGKLRSTQEQIEQCLTAARRHTNCQHYEVETYAWGVLPPELQQPELAAGIAEELKWLERLAASVGWDKAAPAADGPP
jgi:hypothetical protein